MIRLRLTTPNSTLAKTPSSEIQRGLRLLDSGLTDVSLELTLAIVTCYICRSGGVVERIIRGDFMHFLVGGTGFETASTTPG